MNFLGLGLGNLLMNDDAAGLRVIYALQDIYPTRPDFQLVDGGTLGLDLLTYIEWADKLLLLDAIDIGAAPGSVALIDGDDIDSVLEAKVSPHQVGMSDLLAAAELIDDRPRDVTLLGVQYASVNMEMTLSPEVEAALPKMIDAARQLIDAHLQG
ncbi:MAG: HyaD/HybD family hydrogenase maturation endopeptidase [Desulfuromonadales bacterium]|nr:HyaD/HybD family hydrogenase maturation endopeptidase [Desulfuromonadales bacterium]MBN2791842.1 HyaD/HybD family hydrogenase maturation endopeptidase [Desulfuromonadales bacterium]